MSAGTVRITVKCDAGHDIADWIGTTEQALKAEILAALWDLAYAKGMRDASV